MVPEESLACAWEVENDVDCLCDLILVWDLLLCVELELSEPGVVASFGVKDGGLRCQDFCCIIIVNCRTFLVEYCSVPCVRQLRHTDKCQVQVRDNVHLTCCGAEVMLC